MDKEPESAPIKDGDVVAGFNVVDPIAEASRAYEPVGGQAIEKARKERGAMGDLSDRILGILGEGYQASAGEDHRGKRILIIKEPDVVRPIAIVILDQDGGAAEIRVSGFIQPKDSEAINRVAKDLGVPPSRMSSFIRA